MKRKTKVSWKPLLSILAIMLAFGVLNFSGISTFDVESVAVTAQTAKAGNSAVSGLKADLVSVSYVDENLKLYYKVKFTNESSVKITKAKIKTKTDLGETVVRNKTVTLNLEPGESKTVNIYIDRVVDNPGKEGCSLKVKKVWSEE